MGEQKSYIDEQGWKLVLVHMGEGDETLPIPEDSNLSGVSQLSDPHCELYRSFGLEKGTAWQLFRPGVWLRGLEAVRKGNGGGKLEGDGLQLSGMFLIENEEVTRSHVGKDAADIGSPADLQPIPQAEIRK